MPENICPVARDRSPSEVHADAPHGYEIFKKKEDGCIKVVLKPGA